MKRWLPLLGLAPFAVYLALFLAYGVLVLPFAYRAIVTDLHSIDARTLTEAARSLGAGWVTVFVRVIAPNMRSGLLGACLISSAIVLGEFTLLGPSGCGKTTALRIIAGLETATEGKVFIGGEDVSDTPVNRRDLGMVFQSSSLFPHLTVAQNVAFGLEMRTVPKSERADRVAVMHEGVIAQLGTPEELYRRPTAPFVADFIGQSNRVPGRVEGENFVLDGASLLLISTEHAQGAGTALVRPENIRLARAGREGPEAQGVPATVISSGFLGSHRRTTVELPGGEHIISQHAADQVFEHGDAVIVEFLPEPVMVAPTD